MSISIQLLPSQRFHYDRLWDITRRSRIYIDTSIVGAGKTYVSLYLASRLKKSVIVVCPLNVVEKWVGVTAQYGIKAQVLTYDKLASGGVRSLCVHTDSMLIVDEFHYVIHDCKRTKALFSLASVIVKTPSYIGFLSATPFTKDTELQYFSSTLLSLVGHNSCGFHHGRALCIVKAATPRFCLPRDVAYEISRMLPMEPMDHITSISSKIESPDFSFSKLEILNLVYRHTSKDLYDVLRAIQTAFQVLSVEGIAPDERYSIFMRMVIKQMAILERIKADDFVTSILSTAHTHKNVVFVNYRESLVYIMNALEHLNPVCIHGSINGKTRFEAITAFNTDASVRLIVCNTKATCCGIDLDDKIGSEPRAVYISPSFDYSNMLQAIGRVYRIDSKSLPLVKFIFTEAESMNAKRKPVTITEHRLLKNIERKSKFISMYNKDLCFPYVQLKPMVENEKHI